MLCGYGCGREAKYNSRKGMNKPCCESHYTKCPAINKKRMNSETKKKISNSKKGISIHTPESRKKISEATKGEKNHFYGKKHKESSKMLMSKKHTGKILTTKTKEKISESVKGEKNHFYGKKHTNESIKLMKENHSNFKGKYNPNWKGGISCEPYCKQWLDQDYKESIKERDGYMCLNPLCNNKHDLCLHHIDYNKKNCHPFNLITVCRSCNGKANKDRDWHKEWYKTIIFNRYIKGEF